jgi:hypothetical protein
LLNWTERQANIAHLAERQLFFVGGAPRSGTTWVQQILDSHPDVSCRGEALFSKELAEPLERLMVERCRALDAKNKRVFAHSVGFPLPAAADVEFLLGTAILLAMHQQSRGKPCLAIGEKTPENVFFFPRLKRLFPTAKLICIARDPRDVLTSAWHFFHRRQSNETTAEAKIAFIRSAIPSLRDGARTMLALAEQHPDECMIVTYESLHSQPAPVVAGLFRFLGVSSRDAVVTACLTRTSFMALTGGRAEGVEQSGSFLRKGVVGDWHSTLTPEMNGIILQDLGWMFSRFGWQV